MRLGRLTIGLGALLVAGLALYVLTSTGQRDGAGTKAWNAGSNAANAAGQPGTRGSDRPLRPAPDAPALDEIDADSRKAMRDLLREADAEADRAGAPDGEEADRW